MPDHIVMDGSAAGRREPSLWVAGHTVSSEAHAERHALCDSVTKRLCLGLWQNSIMQVLAVHQPYFTINLIWLSDRDQLRCGVDRL